MKQTNALDILKAGRNVYLTGAPGSGKTHVLTEYIAYLQDRNVPAALTASTGIAATHIGGTTIHSWSGIGIKDWLSDVDIDALKQNENLYTRYAQTSILIIDEVSMLTPAFFDSLDRLARAMKQPEAPFGGMQIVLSGDFFQLPPVNKNSDEIQFINSADAWANGDFRICYLSEQYRQDAGDLARILHEIRSGDVSHESRVLLYDCNERVLDITPTRLFTHNTDVDALNAAELEKLPGKSHSYSMQSRGNTKTVASLKKGVLVPEELHLKEGAVVMFVKNNYEAGYVNGTLGIIEDFEQGIPVVRTTDDVLITAHPVSWGVEDGGEIRAQVTQIPLRLAWAITIHKSQGMTIDAAEIDLSKCFVTGQGYVALSRLRSLDGLVLHGLNDTALTVDQNILTLDRTLQQESEKWERVISRFSDADMQDMQTGFIERCGGNTDPEIIATNKEKEKHAPKERVSTYEETRRRIADGKTIQEVAEERGMVISTIIGHLEKLRDTADLDLSHIQPDEHDLACIRDAFTAAKTHKLAPVHKICDGAYSYEELRIARLFL